MDKTKLQDILTLVDKNNNAFPENDYLNICRSLMDVYNEEIILEKSICTLQAWCAVQPEYSWNIVIANNASTDRTL